MAWLSIFDLTLGTVPQNFVGGDVKYSGPAVTFLLGPVTFGLHSNAGVSLALHTSGVLTTFHDGLDQPVERNVAIPAGVVYLALTLNLNISGNATFLYSGGAYGATAGLDTTRTYAISFYKAFSPSTPVRQAVARVVESCVLPLNRETFSDLAEDDYLLHEFDGNLHLAFGAYAGIDTVVYGGHSALDLSKTRLSPLATFSVEPASTPVRAIGSSPAWGLSAAALPGPWCLGRDLARGQERFREPAVAGPLRGWSKQRRVGRGSH